MSDPKHLTDEGSEATDFERELLLAGQNVGLSADDKHAIWAGVALQCVPAAGASAAAGAAGKGSAVAAKVGWGLTPLVKGLLVVAGLGGISVGAYLVQRAPRDAAQHAGAPVAPAALTGREALAAASPAVLAPVIAPTQNPVAVASAAEVVSTPAVPSHAGSLMESPSALSDESAAVLEIRRTLRAGDPSGALRLLEQARLKFPHGVLGQEREALTIEALAKSGAAKAASRKAAAFLRAHPTSPYASDMQALLAD